MKPMRISIAHNLIVNYGLFNKMSVYRPYRANSEDMLKFHSEDYIYHLRSIRGSIIDGNVSPVLKGLLKKFCIGTSENDCPIFENIYDFCQIYTGGSIAAAVNLNLCKSDIAINWSGGLHHAKKQEASGFCYVRITQFH